MRNKQRVRIKDLWAVSIGVIATITSIVACVYYFQHHEILLYGDALSHMRISRGVFDSLTPGIAQLGSVWLPLPHILMWPFIWNDYLWHSGLAGSFVSMPCYIVAAIYLFLSARKLTGSNVASFIGTLAFIFNPNILYLQSTPLSETVCIVTLAMTCYYFLSWIQNDKTFNLVIAAMCCFFSTLARYDGWVLFMSLALFVPLVGILKHQKFSKIQSNAILFVILAGFGIALWFAWNKIIFGDPLYFQRSEYSSLAQQMQELKAGNLFTYHNLWQSIRYYTIDSVQTVGLTLFVLAVVALIWFVLHRRFDPITFGVLAFVSPFALYVASLYSGNAILWIPGAVPPTAHVYLYNVRYGSQIVAPVALCLSLFIDQLIKFPFDRLIKFPFLRYRTLITFALVITILLQCISVARQGIITLQEGTFNYSCNTSVDEIPITNYLNSHYNGGLILEDITASFSATDAGIDFKNIIYVGSGNLWHQALQNPEASIEWIIVNPSNQQDVVAQYVNVDASNFLAHFALVIKQDNNLRLYHRIKGTPLANRPMLPVWNLKHYSCNLG